MCSVYTVERKSMENLITLISELGIILETSKVLPKKINGFYYQDEFHNIIVINNHVKSEKEFRLVLTHELGHYFTSMANNPVLSYSHYANIINSHRNEFRAIRWACEYLVPTNSLLDYMKSNTCVTNEEIIDHFEVNESLLQMKYYFMGTQSNRWKIDCKRTLILSSLPSIYIYDEF